MAIISPFYGVAAHFVSVFVDDGEDHPSVQEIESTCSARMRGLPAQARFVEAGERPGERVYKITFGQPTAGAAGRSG